MFCRSHRPGFTSCGEIAPRSGKGPTWFRSVSEGPDDFWSKFWVIHDLGLDDLWWNCGLWLLWKAFWKGHWKNKWQKHVMDIGHCKTDGTEYQKPAWAARESAPRNLDKSGESETVATNLYITGHLSPRNRLMIDWRYLPSYIRPIFQGHVKEDPHNSFGQTYGTNVPPSVGSWNSHREKRSSVSRDCSWVSGSFRVGLRRFLFILLCNCDS